MSNEINSPVGAPEDPVTHPDVPDDPHPTEPEGSPDPPPSPGDEPNRYPVSDPPLAPDIEPVPSHEPVPPFPEPIPRGPTDVVF